MEINAIVFIPKSLRLIIPERPRGHHFRSQPEQNPVQYEKCLNHLTKPLPGPLRHAMILAENSSNQFYAVGEELCKLQLQQLICFIHQLSLTLKNSTKIANENLNQLSLTVQTIADSTNTAR